MINGQWAWDNMEPEDFDDEDDYEDDYDDYEDDYDDSEDDHYDEPLSFQEQLWNRLP